MQNRNRIDQGQMRKYICTFMEGYAYDAQAMEHLLFVYDQITENAETWKLLSLCLQSYQQDHFCPFDAILQNAEKMAQILSVHIFTVEFLVFLCLSRHLKELYIEKDLPLIYYEKSMADLKYKLEECRLVHGIIGSFVAKWFVGFFRLTRFGIGRLQFEVIPFGDSYAKDDIIPTPESKVINIHIPRSKEPLTPRACLEAYEEAKTFFKAEVGMDPCPFVCDTYLLYPENETFLPPSSNTYQFFKSFEIISVRPDEERRNLWRLFDTQEKNLDHLPADTSLRRAFLAHLKRGGKMGIGRGILFI